MLNRSLNLVLMSETLLECEGRRTIFTHLLRYCIGEGPYRSVFFNVVVALWKYFVKVHFAHNQYERAFLRGARRWCDMEVPCVSVCCRVECLLVSYLNEGECEDVIS